MHVRNIIIQLHFYSKRSILLEVLINNLFYELYTNENGINQKANLQVRKFTRT